MGNKEKIILVLRESIKIARKKEFEYINMVEIHKQIATIESLNKTMDEKIELFKNIDESSQTYKSIFDCAKLALSTLQEKQQYNYYSADLIMKFFKIEREFSRRLRPIGYRIIDEKINKHVQTQNIAIKQTSENEIELKREFISEDMNGARLNNKIKKQQQLSEALKNASFQ